VLLLRLLIDSGAGAALTKTKSFVVPHCLYYTPLNTSSFLKKEKKVNKKKYGETDLLKGKNYYPPKP